MKYKATVQVLTDWQRIAEKAAFTQRLEAKPITMSFLRKMIISEHSPLRAVKLELTVLEMPYNNHVHFIRHWVYHTPWVSTQRPDAMNPVGYDRDAARQDAPVNWTEDCNVQSLIDMMKKRLCMKADTRTRQIAAAIVWAMRNSDDLFLVCLSHACRPACEWQGRECHETFGGCGLYPVMDEKEFWK